jgi:biofilm PGA synthesis lipoprotein PgaB
VVGGLDRKVVLMPRRPRGLAVAAVFALLAVPASLAAARSAGAAVPEGAATARPAPLVAILCYHDISGEPGTPMQTVSPEFLRAQIRACKREGWTFLPLSELLARRDHSDRLPARVMVLTFDDGYRSFLERALPILREEGVTPTLSIITSFVDRPPTDLPPLLTWDEIRRIDQSGEAEIASHSHDLHRFETCDPYKDTAPSVAARRYLLAEARYEGREEYRARVGRDLLDSQHALHEQLGHDAAALVWPYGLHNEMARGLAERAGFSATLALGWRAVTPEDLRAGCLPRIMVTRNTKFAGADLAWLRPPAAPVRAAQVDLDALYDPDPAVFRGRVERLVARAREIGATHVFLQVCADPRGDGTLRQAYGMNHQLPVSADVWSMVACKLAQARIRVWARVPTMNLTWVWDQHPEWRLRTETPTSGPARWRTRLSPDLPEVHRAAIDLLTDLAVYLPLDGVLFDDDAFVRPGERLALGRGPDATGAAGAIRDLLEDCKTAVRAWRPECKFGRTIDASVVETAGVHPALAQDYAQCLRDYDLTVVAAHPPARRGVHEAGGWIGPLARRAVERWRSSAASRPFASRVPSRPDLPGPGAPATLATTSGRAAKPAGANPGPPRVLFRLDAYDGAAGRWIPSRALLQMVAEARRAGLSSLGVAPLVPDQGEIPAGLLDSGTPPEWVSGMPDPK